MIFISHSDVVLSAQKFEANVQMLFENLTDPGHYQKWIRPQVITNDQSSVNLTKGNYQSQIFCYTSRKLILFTSEPLCVNVSIDLYNFATVDEITSVFILIRL